MTDMKLVVGQHKNGKFCWRNEAVSAKWRGSFATYAEALRAARLSTLSNPCLVSTTDLEGGAS
jgi:hypothetical protein